jgi:hypothetical protein
MVKPGEVRAPVITAYMQPGVSVSVGSERSGVIAALLASAQRAII